MYIIIGYVHQFIGHCLIPIDPLVAQHSVVTAGSEQVQTSAQNSVKNGSYLYNFTKLPCDVIKMREMREEVGMQTPTKEMDNHSFL